MCRGGLATFAFYCIRMLQSRLHSPLLGVRPESLGADRSNDATWYRYFMCRSRQEPACVSCTGGPWVHCTSAAVINAVSCALVSQDKRPLAVMCSRMQ